jgi:hypothetical protein
VTSSRSTRPAAARLILPIVLLLLCALLAVGTAVSPATGGVLGAIAGMAGLTAALALGLRPAYWILPVPAIAGVVITALYPTAGLALGALLLITVLAVRAPPLAFVGSLAMFGLEGTLKMRLSVEGAPSPLALGAALIDLSLIISVTGLVAHDRGAALRRLWSRFGTAERVVAGALLAWLALSVVQIPLGGKLGNGLEGFRLVHFYLLGVVGGILTAAQLKPDRLTQLLLVVLGAIAAYATFRGIVGPTENERAFAASRSPTEAFGEHPRDVGSFNSVVALVSYMVPGAVFALVVAYLRPRWRILGAAVFLMAMFGIIASYVRTALVAVVAGGIALAALLVGGSGVDKTRKVYATALTLLVLAAGYGATLIAGEVDPIAEGRAESLSNPFTDSSVTLRLDRWKHSLDKLSSDPLGTGVGTTGRATFESRKQGTYTDSSFVKILQEQGYPGGFLFLFAMIGAVALCARRLARAGPLSRPVGVAALAAFVAFLVLCLMGEYVEQPGKTLSWAMLGITTWEAFGR